MKFRIIHPDSFAAKRPLLFWTLTLLFALAAVVIQLLARRGQ